MSTLTTAPTHTPEERGPAPEPVDADWTPVCALEQILPDAGVAALVERRQIAILRFRDGRLLAIDNHDPCSGANVLARGIVGDVGEAPVVASPSTSSASTCPVAGASTKRCGCRANRSGSATVGSRWRPGPPEVARPRAPSRCWLHGATVRTAIRARTCAPGTSGPISSHGAGFPPHDGEDPGEGRERSGALVWQQ